MIYIISSLFFCLHMKNAYNFYQNKLKSDSFYKYINSEVQ